MSYYGDSMSYYYGGAFANHSSLMTGTGRVYTPHRFAPHLSTISESPLSNYRRYAPVILPSRPKRIIDTADIDVSTPRTLHSDYSRPGNRLRRDRPTIRIRSQALKDNPTLREHNERHEKTVGELLREKFYIKDKKSSDDAPKIRQLAHEPLEDPSEAPQGKLTRRMTRRRSSADIQMDPGQLERELAIAQVQAEVLDNLVAEEQAEIEVEVRRGTLLHKSQLRSAALSKSESEADKSDDTKKKIPKKIKKKKKVTDKPSPPSSAPSTPGEDGKDPAKGFKIEACNSVGDFSTIVVNAKDKHKGIELRESFRLPPPKSASKMDSNDEEVIILPIKKPYVLDNSRNSVYLTLRQQIAKSSGPSDDEGGANQRSSRLKMDRIKKENELKPANIRAKDTFKSDTEVAGVINVIDDETSVARCGITSDAKLLMKASEELPKIGEESSQGVIDESAVDEKIKEILTGDIGKDVCEDMAITSEDGDKDSVWELREANPGVSQVVEQGLMSPGSPAVKEGDANIQREKEDEVMGEDCSELKISDEKSKIAASQTDKLEKNKPVSKLKSSLSESQISDHLKLNGVRKEKLDKSKSLSIDLKASKVEKKSSLERKKPSDDKKMVIKQEKLVDKSKSLSIESPNPSVPEVKTIDTTRSLDESKSSAVVEEIPSDDKKLVDESQSLAIHNEIPSIIKPEVTEKQENIEELKSSEDVEPSNENHLSPLENQLPLESTIGIEENETLDKLKPVLIKEESLPTKEEPPEKLKPLSKSKSFIDTPLNTLPSPQLPKLKAKPKPTKSKFLSTDSGIGSLELNIDHSEKKTKKKLQNSKGSSFESDEDPKRKLKHSEKQKIPPVKKLKKKLTGAKTLPLPLLEDPPKEIILTRVSAKESPPKGPFKSLISFPMTKPEPKALPSLKEDEKTDEIDFWSEIRSSSPPKIDPPKLSLKPQLPDDVIKHEIKPNTNEIIQGAIAKEVKLPEAIFDNSLSSQNSLTSERSCETAETTGMKVLLSPVNETQSEVPGDDVKSVESEAVVEAKSTGVVETSDVETPARDKDRKLVLDVSGGTDTPVQPVPEEGSEPSTPVAEVPPSLMTVDPIPEVPEALDDGDEDDSPMTPTNEDASGGLSKWNKTTDLTTLDGKNVPSSDAGNEVVTPKVSKKKLSRRKKSGSEDTIIRRVPEKITSSTEASKVCQTPKKNLKASPPKPAKRPIDLNKMFYTTPSSLLTATPRDLAKVKRVKVKKEKQPVRTPSASSDSTGSTRSSQDTTSSRSNSTVEDENGQKRISSTRSNDSGFDGSPRLSTPSQSSDNQRNSDSSDHVHGSGRITPPATNLPRFKKYTVEDFHFLKVLGKGSFGKVLLAELRGTDCVYAVKCLKKDVVLEDDDVECTLIERKVLTLATRHPYLCHLFCTFQTDSHLFFVMEYLNGGDLMFHIQKSGRFPEFRARFYAGEIWSGLNFLHKKGIVYRDLKLDNVLLDFEGHIRIADFGMCKLQIFLDRTADTFCGTPDYMAPEIIKGLKYNQAVDWWSFGVLLYEMLTGQSPFSGCDEDELFWSICNERPFIPRYLSQEAMDVLVALLEKDAGKRPMGHEIQAHAFFHSLSWDRLERRLLDPPFKPALEHTLDTRYFDTAFTAEKPRLTPVPEQILTSMDQGVFRGFSYTNPNATD